jgi:uncharacterized membrane protein
MALVASLPWLTAMTTLPGGLRRLLDFVYLPLCHHDPLRTLAFAGAPMCVCSRCAGLYAGLALGFLLGPMGLAARRFSPLFVTALSIIVLDIVTRELGLHGTSHGMRLATGALLGWTAAAWMVVATGSPARRSPAQHC